MKIAIISAYITSNVPQEYYSSQQFNLAKSIVKHGHEVHIFTMNLNGMQRCEKILNNGLLKIVYLSSAFKIFQKAGLPLLKNLLNEVKKEQYDIIQVTGDYHPTSIQVILSQLPGKRVLFHGINEYSRSYFKRLLMKMHDHFVVPLLRKKVDLVIAKTSQAACFMKRMDFKKVVKLPVGYDPEIFFPANKSDIDSFKKELNIKTENICLYVGNLIPRRKVEVQILAFAKVVKKFQNARFLIVGKGLEKNRLRQLTNDLGIKSNILFINQVPNRNLHVFFSAARCFLFTPLYEAFGMVILEALGCRCPVITTPIPAAVDIINDKNGIIIPFDDYLQLADSIEKIFSGTTVFDKRSVIESVNKFHWDNLVEKYLNLYSVIISNKFQCDYRRS